MTVSKGNPTTNEQMPPNPPASKFALGLKRILSLFALQSAFFFHAILVFSWTKIQIYFTFVPVKTYEFVFKINTFEVAVRSFKLGIIVAVAVIFVIF